jgi:hypothetical protein
MKSNEKLRNDMEVREAVQDVLDAKDKAVKDALALIQQAQMLLVAVPYYNVDEPLYTHVVAATSAATREAQSYIQHTEHTETYVGNVAASELGRMIKQQLDAEVSAQI